GEEHEHEGETFKLVPSPRDVPTYDHKPQMSAYEATDAIVEGCDSGKPAFAIINFANADMVGHTGVIEAAVKAIEAVDECLGRVGERDSYAPGTFCWIDLATIDAAGATAFYSALFGWEPLEPIAEAHGYTMLQLGGRDVAALYEQGEAERSAGAPPHWSSY